MYERLTLSDVKFYQDLSAGFENLPGKPVKNGDNCLLARR